jgi:Uma2 family endonuclease
MAVQPATTLPLHRLDVETYNRMVDCGALDGQPVELLEGVLVEVSPPSPAHATVTDRLTRHLSPARQWWLRVQSPLEVPSDSVPEPDLTVLAGEPSPHHHPTTALLAIEVAVSSQLVDRNVKGRLYARARVPVYWLVDIPGKTIEVGSEPGPNGYRKHESYSEADIVPSPLAGIDDLHVGALLAGING